MLKISLHDIVHALTRLRGMLLMVALLLVLACAGLILTLRYSILPDIDRFHSDITSAASSAIGMDVEISRIEADWRGLAPHLRLSGIRILDKQQRTTLALQRVDVVVSWLTLLTGELRLHSLEIQQPDLIVKRDKSGMLHISGVQLGGQSTDNNFANMLLKQSSVVVRGAHISWLDEMQSKPILTFKQVNLLLENGWNFHRFALRAVPPSVLSTPLDVRGDLYGKSFDDLQGWEGEVFAQIDYADLTAWKTWLPLPDALKQGKGALRGWLSVEKGKVTGVTADLALVNLQTRLAADLPPLDIRVLGGRIGWHEPASGFEIFSHNLTLKLSNGFELKPTDLFVSMDRAQNGELTSGEIRANLIELDGLATLMEYLPLERQYKDRYTALLPQGRLENLRAKWHADDDAEMHYSVAARFSGLSLRRTANLPGFSGLSGEVKGSDNQGSLSIKSRGLQLDAPQFLPEPLAFDSVSMQSSWQKNSGKLEFKMRNVAVANEDLAGTAYGSYLMVDNSPGKMDLNVHLTRASVPHAGKYIPLLALDEEARSWVSSSLLAGQSNDFNLRIKGDLKDFPFIGNRKGIFKIHARANDVALGYAPDWPRIYGANAELLIQGNELTVNSVSARTADVNLKNVRVSIPDVLSKALMLNINGQAEASNSQALGFIQASPVRGYIDGFTDDLVVQGEGRLDLKLEIPLSGSQPLKVAGAYHFTDSEIEFGNYLPTARKVNGDLLFSESGVSTKNIVAQILGGPAKLAIDTTAKGDINIKLGGRANFDTLYKTNPQPLLKKLKGDPAWNLDIALQDKRRKVKLTSTLLGLQSDLPAPLSKRAEESVPLRFEMDDPDADHEILTVQYGAMLNANILRQKDEEEAWKIKRGIINFGNVPHKADREGLWLIGTLPRLSLEGWGDLAGTAGAGEGNAPIELAGADLVIQKMTGYGNMVNDLHIHASSQHGILSAQLASSAVNGELSWQSRDVPPGSNGRLVARLKNLDLGVGDSEGERKKLPEQKMPENKLHAASPANMRLPVIDLAIEKLRHKGQQFGKLELFAEQKNQDYLLEHLRLSNEDGVLTADGKWQMSEDAAKTQVHLKLDIGNAGKVLARAGYPNSVKNGKGRVEGAFSWSGTPAMYSSAGLDGNLSLDTSKGQFLQIDPGIGKLLSILSLQALPKRIALDFEDVFSKGFEFDSIKGNADIRQGVMHTDNLKIEGSSAKVSMKGQIDLVNETQDLNVRIVPAVGNSVALISALVATPVVGAGVYLAGKILDDPLGQLVSFEYAIKGSWVDPQVAKLGTKLPAGLQ